MEGIRIRRYEVHLILWIHLDNTHIRVNNPENHPKTVGDHLSTASCRDMAGNKLTSLGREWHSKHEEWGRADPIAATPGTGGPTLGR